MKLPFTEKFLWDLYLLLEELDEVYQLFSGPKTWRDVFCPELAQLRRKYERERGRRKFGYLISYLKRKGYIKIKNLEGKEGVLITKRGAEKILKISLKLKDKKRRPDKKWIMVIFDIPEKKKSLRNILRERLQIMGYQKLQRSIWICPYDFLKETEQVIRQYALDPYVQIFLIKEIKI